MYSQSLGHHDNSIVKIRKSPMEKEQAQSFQINWNDIPVTVTMDEHSFRSAGLVHIEVQSDGKKPEILYRMLTKHYSSSVMN